VATIVIDLPDDLKPLKDKILAMVTAAQAPMAVARSGTRSIDYANVERRFAEHAAAIERAAQVALQRRHRRARTAVAASDSRVCCNRGHIQAMAGEWRRRSLALSRREERNRADPVLYRYLMKRTVGGRDELLLSGLELVRKLAVLVPPPRVHQTRFLGVFAPNAKLRAAVVPRKPAPRRGRGTGEGRAAQGRGTYRIDWGRPQADLQGRRLAAGAHGEMRVLSVIEEPDVIEKILRHKGLPPVPLPTSPALGQRAFDFDTA
jgi:hypothetical protein